MSEIEQADVELGSKLWPRFRKLLVLQVKLYVDALRDLLVSALALGAFLIDLVQGREGPDCYFERVMRFGRRTESVINLFNQYDPSQQSPRSVDNILNKVEDHIRRQ